MIKTISILLAFFLMSGVKMDSDQENKEPLFTIKDLSVNDVQTIYTTIDNAALPGEIRKPLLKKIEDQYNKQLEELKKADSTKEIPKKN